MPADFGFWVEDLDDLHVVHVYGELDIVGAERVRDALVAAGRSTVAVDLSGLTFIDASGLGAIVEARNSILAEGSGFRAWGATGIVRRAIDLTGLTSLLTE